MRCSVCGQDYNGKACPFCENAQEGDGASVFFDNGTDAFFQDDPVYAKRKQTYGNRKGNLLLVLIAVFAVAALAATGIFLIPRNKDYTGITGFAAPTGEYETVDNQIQVLTNELLITIKDGYGQKDLEKELENPEGAIVGYLPALRQYQVRFNTNSLNDLNKKIQAIQSVGCVECVDYNFLLSGFLKGKGNDYQDWPSGNGGTIGWLGALPAGPEEKEQVLFLPSYSFPSLDEMKIYLADHPGDPFFINSKDKAILGKGRSIMFASGCYYEKQNDNSLSASMTTGALRYQMAELIEKGCEIICVSANDPLRINDQYQREEAEQMERLLIEMEKTHPSFLICFPYQEDGYLYRTVQLSDTAKNHALFAAAAAETTEKVIDTTGTGKKLLHFSGNTGEGIICAAANNASEAATLTAVWAERELTTAGGYSELRDTLQSNAPAIAFNDYGEVAPALDLTCISGPQTDLSGYHVAKALAQDVITGNTIQNAQFNVSAGTESWSETSAEGSLLLIMKDANITVSAEAAGYVSADTQIETTQTEAVRLDLHRNREETGTVSGRIRFLQGGEPVSLRIGMENTDNGEIYPDRMITQNFNVQMYPGTYHLTVSAHDRTPVTIYGVQIEAGKNTELQEIVISIPSDLPGKVQGQVIDSMNGNTVAGAELKFYNGVNAMDSGSPVYSTRSSANGSYSADLPGGMYTVFASKDQYRTSWKTVYSEGESTTANQNCTLTPSVPDGQVRIALAWGRTPADLDSHLVNKSAGIHVYYPQQEHKLGGRTDVKLDHDDTDSYGPEQTTIMIQQSGEYVFYVHDFTNGSQQKGNSREMAESGATVTVYIGEEEPKVYHVPNKTGTLWKVFSYKNGNIIPSDEVSNEFDAGHVGQ